MLHQSIRFRDTFYYGYAGGGGYGGGGYQDYGNNFYGGAGRGYYGGGGGGNYFGGYQDVGYDIYRYHRVITISAIALGAGVIQFLVSMLLCCVNENVISIIDIHILI